MGFLEPREEVLDHNESADNVTVRKKNLTKFKAMTKGQIEAEISNALISFEKEHMGRGPVEAKTYIIQDIVVVRLKGILTPAEIHLAKDDEGILLIKKVRTKLRKMPRKCLGRSYRKSPGSLVLYFHGLFQTAGC